MSRERKEPRFGPAITEYITLWSYTGNCMVLLIGYSKREKIGPTCYAPVVTSSPHLPLGKF
jgi:hypothetical protein